MALVAVDDDEEALEAEDARLVSDPSISVADLEKALEQYFSIMGYRNMQDILDIIREARVTWKTSPKARAWDVWCSVFRFYVFKVFRV